MIFRLDETVPDHPFPDPSLAENEPNGLLAVGGDLHPRRLLNAYRHGIFPWYSEDQPILWWSPDPRMVLFPEEIHVARSLRRQMRRGGLELRIDSDFAGVLEACATPRHEDEGTWLIPEMRAAYLSLYHMGHAHSFELWQDQRLVGGLYGVTLGRMFFGESMFSRIPSASRIVMVHLCEHLAAHGFPLIDCQIHNPHLERMGAREIPRARFQRLLADAVTQPEASDTWLARPRDCQELAHAR